MPHSEASDHSAASDQDLHCLCFIQQFPDSAMDGLVQILEQAQQGVNLHQANSADDKLPVLFLFFAANRLSYFMQTVSAT